MQKITQEQFDRIENLYESALSALTKKEAKVYIDQIEFVATGLEGYANILLYELINSLRAACGRVPDREIKKSHCNTCLYKLEGQIERKPE